MSLLLLPLLSFSSLLLFFRSRLRSLSLSFRFLCLESLLLEADLDLVLDLLLGVLDRRLGERESLGVREVREGDLRLRTGVLDLRGPRDLRR